MSSAAELEVLFKSMGLDQIQSDLKKATVTVDEVGPAAKHSFGMAETAAIAAGAAIGTAVTAGVGIAIGALSKMASGGVGFIKDSIMAASDMGETVSKTNVVFGDAADTVLKFGETAATSMGMSSQSALAAAATYGNLITAMGFSKEAAAGMSTDLVQLASDLASFNNMDPTEVLEKLRAGLVGETEPLKTLGINMSQARIEAQAMEMGLMQAGTKLGDYSVEAQQMIKAQAGMAIMFKDTSAAQGDFERTSSGLANGIRIIKALFADLQVEVGDVFGPTVEKVAGVVKDVLLGAMEDLRPVLEDLGAKMAAWAESVDWEAVTAAVVKLVDDGIAKLEDFDWVAFGEDVKAALGGIMELAAVLADGLGALAEWKAGIGDAADEHRGFIDALNTPIAAPETFDELGKMTDEFLLKFNTPPDMSGITGAISSAWDSITGATETLQSDTSSSWSTMQDDITSAANEIGSRVQGAFEGMRVAVSGVQATLSAWLTGAWESLRNALDSAATWIHDRITAVWTAVAEATSKAWAWVYNTAMKYASALVNGIRAAFQWVWDRIKAVWEAVANATRKTWEWIHGKISDAVTAISTGISKAYKWIHDRVKGAWEAVATLTGKVWDWIVEKVGNAARAIYSGIVSAFKGIGQKVVSVMGSIGDAVKGALTAVIDNIRGFLAKFPDVGGVIAGMMESLTRGMGDDASSKMKGDLDKINAIPDSAADVLGANFDNYKTTAEDALGGLGDLPDIEPPTFAPIGGAGGAGGQGPFEIGGMYSDNMGDYTFNEMGEKVYTSGVGLAKQNAKAAKDAEAAAKKAAKAGADGIKKGAAEGLKEKAASDLAKMFAEATTAGLAAIEELMSKALPDIERIKERMATVEAFFVEVGQAIVRATDAIGVEALDLADDAIDELAASIELVAGAAQAMAAIGDVKAVTADSLDAIEKFLGDARDVAQRISGSMDAENSEALQAIAQTLGTWMQALGTAAGTLKSIAETVLPANMAGTLAKITEMMDAVVTYSGDLVAKAQTALPEPGDLLDTMEASGAIADTFGAWAAALSDIAGASTAIAGAKTTTGKAIASMQWLMENVARISGMFVTAVQKGIADPGDQAAMLALSQSIAGTFMAWAEGLTKLADLPAVLNRIKAVADTAWDSLQGTMDGVARLTGGFVVALEKAMPDSTERMQSLALSQAIGQTFSAWATALGGVTDMTTKLGEIRGIPVSAFDTVQGVMQSLAAIMRSLIMGDGWDLTKDIPGATAVQGLLRDVISTVSAGAAMIGAVTDVMAKIMDAPTVSAEAIQRVADNLADAFKQVQRIAEAWRGDKTQEEMADILAGVQAYSSGASEAVKLLTTAAGITVKWEEVTIIPARFLGYVGTNITNMLAEIRRIGDEFIARGMTGPGAAENDAIVKGIQAFASVAGAAVKLLVDVAGITVEWGDITHSIENRRLRYVGSSIEKMLDEMEHIAREFIARGYTESGAASNNALVASVSAFMSIAGQAVDIFAKVGPMFDDFGDITHSIENRRLRYVGSSIEKMFDEIESVTSNIVGKYGADTLKALGESISLVLSPVEAFADTIDKLNGIENVRILTEEQVNVARHNFGLIISALFGDPTTGDGGFIQDISEDVAAAKTRTVELVGATADALGKVTDVMGAFMENPFMHAKSMRGGGWKIMDWKPGPLEALKERIRMAIRETVTALTDAFNDTDVQAALASLDDSIIEKLSRLAEAYAKLLDVVTGFDGANLPDMGPLASALAQLMSPISTLGGTGGGGAGGGTGGTITPGQEIQLEATVNVTTNVELSGQTLETLFQQIIDAEGRAHVMWMPTGG